MSFQVTSLDQLRQFKYDRTLKEDLDTQVLILLGTLPKTLSESAGHLPAIITLKRLSTWPEPSTIFSSQLERVEQMQSTDIYSWFTAWLGKDRPPDVKIDVIFPATATHVAKYTDQPMLMFRETPGLYRSVTKPYISAFPASRTKWVSDILSGVSEREKILYDCPQFVLLPDMKSDFSQPSTVYLLAIARDESIRSMRDLRKAHISMLRAIQREATSIARERCGLPDPGSLRFFIHYQPSYYHFHVHIAHVSQKSFMGVVVGQAHLLDDVINLLQLETDDNDPIMERLTFTYGLGKLHGLYAPLHAAGAHTSSQILASACFKNMDTLCVACQSSRHDRYSAQLSSGIWSIFSCNWNCATASTPSG